MENESHIEKLELYGNDIERRQSFTVAVFGFARKSSELDEISLGNATKIGKLIANKGYSLSTGGYDVGTMKAVTSAAKAELEHAQRDPKKYIHAYPFSTDSNIPLPVIEDVSVTPVKNASERIKNLVDASNAFIVLSGGFSTFYELLTVIQYEDIENKNKNPVPARVLIIVDPTEKHSDRLVEIANDEPKFREMPILRNTYFIRGTSSWNTGWDTDVKRILDIYYRKSYGEDVSSEDGEYLEEKSFSYLYRNHLKILHDTGFHL